MFPVFIITYFAIYGAMHLYFYFGLKNILSGKKRWIFLPFALFMLFALPLSRFCEGTGLFLCQKPLAFAGYIWMGFLFLTVSCLFLMHLLRLFWFFATRLLRKQVSFPLTPGRIFSLSLAIALFFCIYGSMEAGKIRTEHILFETSRLPETVEKFRLVQISDLHLGVMTVKKRIHTVAETIGELEPDIIVSTGDFVDGQMGEMDGISSVLAGLDPPRGKYAVTGNHEFYTGLDHALEFTEKCGFEILRNSSIRVGNFLSLAGIDDPAGRTEGKDLSAEEKEILKGLSKDSVRLLLKHQPVVEEGSEGLYDLQLSGHTHGGQIFPFTFFTRLAYGSGPGLSTTGKDSFIYISRGTGTWGPPFRVFAPPEVTVIDLVRSQNDESSVHLKIKKNSSGRSEGGDSK
jgi:predicted MPP superfamily phosphohydrolase